MTSKVLLSFVLWIFPVFVLSSLDVKKDVYRIDLTGHIFTIQDVQENREMSIDIQDSLISSPKTHFKIIADTQENNSHYFLVQVYAYLFPTITSGELGAADVESLFIIKVNENLKSLGVQQFNYQSFLRDPEYRLDRTFEGYFVVNNRLYIRVHQNDGNIVQYVVMVNLSSLKDGFIVNPKSVLVNDKRFNTYDDNGLLITQF